MDEVELDVEDRPLMKDKRLRQRIYDRTRSFGNTNISPVPTCVDPDRKESCRHDLKRFLEVYFPEAFAEEWSKDHVEVIRKIEQVIRGGGFFAIAMPRGSGKTTIIVRAAIWAILYGHMPYVFLVAADAGKAKSMLKSIKTEIEFNQLLFEDFPEACYPVRCLGGVSQSAGKQHVDGIPTLLDWTADCAQLPYIEGSECAGARIGVGGVTAASRGAQVTLPDGRVIRPSLLLVDDFQTRESAASEVQCKTRLDIITADLAGMRPPTGKMAILATMTVIYENDAADKLLNRKLYPEWHGVRKKILYKKPHNEALWEEYMELRKEAFARDAEPTNATEFYLARRAEMDAGAEVAWPERHTSDEVSALQHCYNLLCDQGPEAFASEYQNEPMNLEDEDFGFLTADQIAEKLSHRPKGDLPGTVQKITAAIDVQQNSLWYAVIAWTDGFSGWVVDYGCYPKQPRRFYSKTDLPQTLRGQPGYEDLNDDQAIFKGLQELCGDLLTRKWKLGDGSEKTIDRLLIDEGYKPATVHLFCRTFGYNSVIMPVKGMGIRAGRQPMHEWPVKKGERVGQGYRIRATVEDRVVRHILVDSNFWKTFLQYRLAAAMGGDGCLVLWGTKALEHRLLAQHLTSETATRTEGWGRTLLEWELKPHRPDNEFLDCFYYCCAAASEQGLTLIGEGPPRRRNARSGSKFMSLAEKRAEKARNALSQTG